MKKPFQHINLVYLILVLLLDLAVYMVLGLLLMGYDDTYDSSKGEYWSLASMNTREKVFYIAINAWNVLNVIGIIYLLYRVFKRVKYGSRLKTNK
jgi:hypothetical protein